MGVKLIFLRNVYFDNFNEACFHEKEYLRHNNWSRCFNSWREGKEGGGVLLGLRGGSRSHCLSVVKYYYVSVDGDAAVFP